MSEKTISKNIFTTRQLVFTALMSVIIAVCSWISIPSEVPFTLQTFAVFCALSILGGKCGTFAVLVYIILGAVGIPVFAGFSGGLGILLGPTGGYIIGFLILAGVYWLGEKLSKSNFIISIISMLIGLLLCYAFGTAWFMYVYANKAEAIDLATALKWCVLPFIIPDLIKLAIALLISSRVKKYADL